ncbi:Uncharacterised protein [Klebsiella aerogenes]|nr:Uncharacterised protein [Klebsiella aerogenes]
MQAGSYFVATKQHNAQETCFKGKRPLILHK